MLVFEVILEGKRSEAGPNSSDTFINTEIKHIMLMILDTLHTDKLMLNIVTVMAIELAVGLHDYDQNHNHDYFDQYCNHDY